jgi:hypothetical protein
MEARVVNGKSFSLVKRQRSGASVYRNKSEYLRIGPTAVVERILAEHTRMESLGFPVPRLIVEGKEAGERYFIEASLGEKRFLELFEEDIRATGRISDTTFDSFLHIVGVYLHAQLASPDRPRDVQAFARSTHLDFMRDELPQHAVRIQETFDANLRALDHFSFKLMHGDLGPANMYPRGIIDFEDTASGPVGFDIASALMVSEWFPREGDYEYYERAHFTPEQLKAYCTYVDNIFSDKKLPAFSSAYPHFEFFRAMWFTVRMHQWPKLQKYRYDLFIKKYLS